MNAQLYKIPVFAALALAALFSQGCETEGCLGGEAGCVVPSPCKSLAFTCQGGPAAVKVIEWGDEIPTGQQAQGAAGDILLSNDRVLAVIDSINHRSYLAPSGGNLLDLSTRGDDNESLTHMFLATGILPGDAVYYEEMEIVASGPDVAAVQFRGRLDGHEDARVYTRYEVRRCDPGIRMRTEIINLETEPVLWPVFDTFFWAGRETQPFVPLPGAGFDIPDLDLENIGEILFKYPFMAAAAHTDKSASYAITGCNQSSLEGFNDDEVSAMGLARRLTPPRDYRIYERFLAVGNGTDIAASADIITAVREQLYDEEYITVSGRSVLPGGDPVGGDETRVSLHISQTGDEPTPWSQVVPKTDGRFSARVPAKRDYLLDVWAFGRVVASRRFSAANDDVDLGDIQVPHAATVELAVQIDGAPGDALVLVQPADDETREAVTGKLNGRFKECAPLLGAPYGPSPACNRVLIHAGGPVTVEVPVGRYHIYATAGPFATLARRTLQLTPQAHEAIDFSLQRVPVKPAGTLAADLHVHCGKSFDSVFPERDRVISILAASLDVIAATDHDLTHDYKKAIDDLGVGSRLVVMPGTEATGYILFLNVPGALIPKVIGHWNFWPLRYEAYKPNGGVPWTQLAEPGELFERMEKAYTSTPVIQLNHPWLGDFAGRDQGWPRALELKFNQPLPQQDDGTSAGLFVRVPKCGPERATGCRNVRTRNDAYHVQEVMSGTKNRFYLPDRGLWFYLLNQGKVHAATANSDSHMLTDDMIGSPRNIIYTSTTVADFDPDVFNRAVREGRMFGTNGPMVEIAVTDAGGAKHAPSTQVFQEPPGANLEIRVSAAPWIPIEEVRIYVNGELKKKIAGELSHPADPFGTQGVLRYQGEVPLAGILPAGNRDAYIVVDAGTALPLAGDLNQDGVLETSDNNGDGRVDIDDVKEEKRGGCKRGAGPGSCGPLKNPAEAEDDSDPRYHFTAVIPESYPLAFTNPLLLDRDGDGIFTGPGLPKGGE